MNKHDFKGKFSSLKKEYPDILNLEESKIALCCIAGTISLRYATQTATLTFD
jgi:hypothetical protein